MNLWWTKSSFQSSNTSLSSLNHRLIYKTPQPSNCHEKQPQTGMDLDLFGAFDEAEIQTRSNDSAVTSEIVFVPKAKRRKHNGQETISVSSKSSAAAMDASSSADIEMESGGAFPSKPVVDVADLPVFTDELVTKTDSGNTLKQVC